MRITYIHQHFRTPDESGGGRPYEFARRLASRGEQVTMVAAGRTRRTYQVSGFTVEEIPSKYDNRMSVPRRIASFLGFMVRACVISARRPVDVVVASSTPLTVVVPGILAARLHRARLVVEIRDLWPKVPLALGLLPTWMGPTARLLERLAYSEADTVIALSPSMAQGVQEIAPKAEVSVIPNASDTDFTPTRHRDLVRHHLGIPENTAMFVYAGSLGLGYDPDWLARLALALEAADARLIVVGDGAGLAPARQLLRDAGLEAERVFIGARSRQEALEIVHAGDISVSSLIDHPALEGNSLNKVFDAMAMGRPIIFNHRGWLSDLLVDAQAGWRWPREVDAGIGLLVAEATSKPRYDKAAKESGNLARSLFDRGALFNKFHAALSGQNFE